MSNRHSPAESPLRMASNEKASVNACLACRKVKMKCHRSASNTVCDRCIRKSFHCVFEKHRRGRKPALRLGHTSLHDTTRSLRAEVATPRQPTASTTTPVLNHSRDDTSEAQQEKPHSDFWNLLESFRPSGLLNKQAMTGKLSLENITHGQNTSEAMNRRDDTSDIPVNDPIRMGIVNSTIAASLFASFMRDLNPYIYQFDPALHTFGYVQRRSAFLLSAILAASAKAFNPSVHNSLQAHAEELFTNCFRSGKKSLEIIQAVLVLTYWKEPDDTRAWLSTGYVIRMCMELGLHKLSPRSTKDQEQVNDVKRRELRSKERTWLLLFMYDRSLSLQTGSPSMIPRNDLIESAHTWYDDPFCTPQDRMLCALVTLRMIGSEIFELLNSHRSSHQSTMLDRTDGLMKLLLKDIQKWQEYWSSVPGMDHDLYQFLIKFFGANLRLLFSLFPLHATLTSGLPDELIDKQSLLISYSSAVEMLQTLIQPAFYPLLYFVQDSIHIMVAYAAIFLVKLLLSIPQSIRSEIEGPAMDAIRNAAEMFVRHDAPQNSGCGLQAKFLQNVLKVFRKAHEPRPLRNHPVTHPRVLGTHQLQNDVSDNEVNAINGVGEDLSMQANEAGPANALGNEPQDGDLATYNNAFGLQDFAYADDEIWADLFANAGFSINEGIFLPYGDTEL